MNSKNRLDEAIDSIKNGIDTIGDNYDSHIREKAVEEVNETIDKKGLKVEQIEDDDYEAMISVLINRKRFNSTILIYTL